MRHEWPTVLIAVGLLALGAYGLVEAWAEPRRVAAAPRLTCDQLVRNGPGDNAFVTITDASMCAGNSVGERDGETGALELYHPLYPAGLAQEPKPADLALLLCILDEHERRKIRDDREQRRQQGQPGCGDITCEVRRGAAHLPRWARNGLAREYPGLPLANCWLLTVGRNAPSVVHAVTMGQMGLLALLAGALVLGYVVWRRASRKTQDEEQAQGSPA